MENLTPEMENISRQRACLMGLIASILRDSSEGLTALQIKSHCAQAFAYMIEHDAMVGDFIDIVTIEACKDFLEQEKALQDVNDMIRGE